MTGENGYPETPDWAPDPRTPPDFRRLDGLSIEAPESQIPANITLGAE